MSTRNGSSRSRSRGEEAVGARDRLLLVHEHAVHVHQPRVDLAAGHAHDYRELDKRSNCRGFGSDRRSVAGGARRLIISMSLINLGTNPYPWPIDGRLADPDPLRRAARLREAGSRSSTRPFAYPVVDLDHGPSATAAAWSGAEELAHQYADMRGAA